MKDRNRNLRIRPNGNRPSVRKPGEQQKNVDGLPIGDTPPRSRGQCKPINKRAKGPLNLEVTLPRRLQTLRNTNDAIDLLRAGKKPKEVLVGALIDGHLRSLAHARSKARMWLTNNEPG
jgi:hypothetical protein